MKSEDQIHNVMLEHSTRYSYVHGEEAQQRMTYTVKCEECKKHDTGQLHCSA